MSDSIRVAVRVRPVLPSEKKKKQPEAWNVVGHALHQTLSARATVDYSPAGRPLGQPTDASASRYGINATPYTYDAVFSPTASTHEVYERSVAPAVAGVLSGVNGCVLAYGQTGSGKTYSMQGTANDHGVVELAARQLFREIESSPEREFMLRVSYFSVYCERVRDLLSDTTRDLRVHTDARRGVFVADMREVVVRSVDELLALLDQGDKRRVVAATKMNEFSSRGHAVVRITVESCERDDIESPTMATNTTSDSGRKRRHSVSTVPAKARRAARPTPLSEIVEAGSMPSSPVRARPVSPRSLRSRGAAVRVSTLALADLAGSERAEKTGARGTTLKEAVAINKSLMALSAVVRGLGEPKKGSKGRLVLPYRDSKLTMLLQDVLSTSSNISLLCCVSPAACNVDETHSTCKFASRARLVKTTAVVNERSDDKALLQRYRREIEKLKLRLAQEERSGHLHREENMAKIETMLQRIAQSIVTSDSVRAAAQRSPLRRQHSLPTFDHSTDVSRASFSPSVAKLIRVSPPPTPTTARQQQIAAWRAESAHVQHVLQSARKTPSPTSASRTRTKRARRSLREKFAAKLGQLEIPENDAKPYTVTPPSDDEDDVVSPDQLSFVETRQLKSLQSSASSLSARVNELEQQNSELAGLLHTRHELGTGDGSAEVAELRDALTRAHKAIAERDARADALAAMLQAQHDRDGPLSPADVAPTPKEVKELREQVAELQADNVSLVAESNTVGEANLSLTQRVSRTETALADTRAELALVQERAAMLAAENLAQAALLTEARTINSGVAAIEKARDDMYQARAALAVEQNARRDAERRVAALERELARRSRASSPRSPAATQTTLPRVDAMQHRVVARALAAAMQSASAPRVVVAATQTGPDVELERAMRQLVQNDLLGRAFSQATMSVVASTTMAPRHSPRRHMMLSPTTTMIDIPPVHAPLVMATQTSANVSHMASQTIRDLLASVVTASTQAHAAAEAAIGTQTWQPRKSVSTSQTMPKTESVTATQTAVSPKAAAVAQTDAAESCAGTQTAYEKPLTLDVTAQTSGVRMIASAMQTHSPSHVSLQTDAASGADALTQTPPSPSSATQTEPVPGAAAVAASQTWMRDTDPHDWEHLGHEEQREEAKEGQAPEEEEVEVDQSSEVSDMPEDAGKAKTVWGWSLF